MGIRIRADMGLLVDDANGDRIVGYIDRAGGERNLDGSPRLPGSTGAILGSANEVSFTPTGSVAGTTAQAAIAEVDSEKVAKAGDSMTGNLDASTGVGASDARLRLGYGRSTAGNAYVDLFSGAGASDMARMVRYAGTNGGTSFLHRGTGDFALIPQDGAPLVFTTGTLEWGRVTATGFSCQGSYFVYANGAIKPGVFTLATLPSAAAYTNALIIVSNATAGPTLCRSDGTNWKILAVSGATVS